MKVEVEENLTSLGISRAMEITRLRLEMNEKRSLNTQWKDGCSHLRQQEAIILELPQFGFHTVEYLTMFSSAIFMPTFSQLPSIYQSIAVHIYRITNSSDVLRAHQTTPVG